MGPLARWLLEKPFGQHWQMWPLHNHLAPLPAPSRPLQGEGALKQARPRGGSAGFTSWPPTSFAALRLHLPSPRCCSRWWLQTARFQCAAKDLVILRVVHKPPSRASSPLILTRTLWSKVLLSPFYRWWNRDREVKWLAQSHTAGKCEPKFKHINEK